MVMYVEGLGCVKTQVVFSKAEILPQLPGSRSDTSSWRESWWQDRGSPSATVAKTHFYTARVNRVISAASRPPEVNLNDRTLFPLATWTQCRALEQAPRALDALAQDIADAMQAARRRHRLRISVVGVAFKLPFRLR